MSAQLQLQYPVYGAAFQDNHHFIVAGGGGEGNNGIPNKVTRVKIAGAKGKPIVNIIDELEYKGDSATGLVVDNKGIITVGINDVSENIKIGENKHLRQFKLSGDEEKISFIRSVDVEHSTDPEIYQKAISASKDGSVFAVVSTRKDPSIVRILNHELKLIKSIEVEEQEVKDVAVSPNGKKVAYITDREIHVINLETGEEFDYGKSPKNYSYTKVKFNTDSSIYIAVSLTSTKGVLLLELGVLEEKELKFAKAKVITNNFSKITSFDISNNDLITIAGNDNSILIVSVEDLFVYKTIKNAHKFAITNVEFSPNGQYLLSSSAASTVSIYEIPSGIRTRLTWLYNALIVLLISVTFYAVKQQITPEQWESFDEWIHYLFDEPVELDEDGNVLPVESTLPLTDATEVALSAQELSTTIAAEIPSTTVELETGETLLSSIEQETAETFVVAEIETTIEVVKEIVIENGDILKEFTSSIVNTQAQEATE